MVRSVQKGVAQFIVLVSCRPSGRYPLETPVLMRNDSRFNTFTLNTRLDCCLGWIASSNFDLHIDRVSSVSA